MESQFFENYEVRAKRKRLGRTSAEPQLVLHAGHANDYHPYHMDAEWGKTQACGQWIAHGTLVFGVATGITAGEVNSDESCYGYERVRFIKPVLIGDTIRTRVSVKERRAHTKPVLGLVIELFEVPNQRHKTALPSERLILFSKEPMLEHSGTSV